MENNQANKFEIVGFGPYRFVGKSVYVRSAASDNWRGTYEILDALWEVNKWVFDELDALAEYASDEPHNAALITWDRYEPNDFQIFGLTVGKTQLMGYCYGRFMKPDCPVPPGCDYIDIPAGEAAKAWTNDKGFDIGSFIRTEIEKSGRYDAASWRFEANVYPKPDADDETTIGFYMSLHPLSELQIAKRENRAMPPIPAIDVGVWPLPEGQYDPALYGVNIPAGARLYGLFDESYYNLPAPESLPGLEKVETLEELESGKYCIYTATSGASYIIAISDKPLTIMIGGYTPETADLTNYVSIKQQEEFLFLGKIYSEDNYNFGKWYEDFFQIGGFDKITPYKKHADDVSETIHVITLKPNIFTAGIGIVADEAIEAPEGYEYKRFPSGECLVVTTEWKPTNDEAHKALDETERIKKMPDGYVDNDQSIYTVIEKFYESPAKGHRWERWYPIKKQ